MHPWHAVSLGAIACVSIDYNNGTTHWRDENDRYLR